ncbi:cell envelope integrity protein TolA [Salmonella enterica subsp. enterica]|nr:cell envelope integrity protein TolA [Salmonella enterica subsp. enterica]
MLLIMDTYIQMKLIMNPADWRGFSSPTASIRTAYLLILFCFYFSEFMDHVIFNDFSWTWFMGIFNVCFKAGSGVVLSVIITLLLAGCVKTDSAIKPASGGSEVDKVPETYKNTTPRATGEEIRKYASQIKYAIERNFYNIDKYSGKQCTLRIKMAPDGMILDIQPDGGDPDLCRAAMKVAKKTKLPSPPSPAIYDVFKKAVLDFQL